jgi:plasmid stabilization system protein ParE
MRVRYTGQAFAEREAIFAYIDERNPSAARAVKAFIERSVERLTAFPLSAPVTDEPGVRELTRSPSTMMLS